ncbi:unannotated protein [freshwater metagenome]|uniref:Unannotated protein n=1 Tax=freshwater metagenome TaxID=449393 RepID=A0A6J7IZY4_9ZZZZ
MAWKMPITIIIRPAKRIHPVHPVGVVVPSSWWTDIRSVVIADASAVGFRVL